MRMARQQRRDRERQDLRAAERQRADVHAALQRPSLAAMSGPMWRSSASTR
jgi:hypothetical protein